LHDPAQARIWFDSARVMMEHKLASDSTDSRYHSALGIAYAGLGRKADALMEGRKGVALLPISTEAWRGGYRLRDLAYIQALVGEEDAAVESLSQLLAVPAEISAVWLRNSPPWSMLWNNQKFQKLVGG